MKQTFTPGSLVVPSLGLAPSEGGGGGVGAGWASDQTRED
jgi:hypothetical protein